MWDALLYITHRSEGLESNVTMCTQRGVHPHCFSNSTSGHTCLRGMLSNMETTSHAGMIIFSSKKVEQL